MAHHSVSRFLFEIILFLIPATCRLYPVSASEVVFLHPKAEASFPFERRLQGDVSREALVLPVTGTTVLEAEAAPGDSRLVFEYGLDGPLGTGVKSATLEVSTNGGKVLGVMPLAGIPLVAERVWRRAVIHLGPGFASTEIRLRPWGYENSRDCSLLVSYPRLVASDILEQRFPNIIVIVIDTLRRDYVGAYRSKKTKTPRIDRLAAQSALFENAFSAIPITQPSHLSLLTGLYPAQT